MRQDTLTESETQRCQTKRNATERIGALEAPNGVPRPL
jgi:hypothetical protein